MVRGITRQTLSKELAALVGVTDLPAASWLAGQRELPRLPVLVGRSAI